jgi:hypothetical protein
MDMPLTHLVGDEDWVIQPSCAQVAADFAVPAAAARDIEGELATH